MRVWDRATYQRSTRLCRRNPTDEGGKRCRTVSRGWEVQTTGYDDAMECVPSFPNQESRKGCAQQSKTSPRKTAGDPCRDRGSGPNPNPISQARITASITACASIWSSAIDIVNKPREGKQTIGTLDLNHLQIQDYPVIRSTWILPSDTQSFTASRRPLIDSSLDIDICFLLRMNPPL